AIFPFEPAVYAGTGLRVEFVGHPLLDRLPPRVPRDARDARRRLGLSDAGRVVALLPGSRRNELRDSLPLQLGAARLLRDADSGLEIARALGPTLPRAALDEQLEREPAAQGPPLRGFGGATHSVLRAAAAV